MERNGDIAVQSVERAMVAIRRSQTRRSLARLARSRLPAAPGEPAAAQGARTDFEVLDALEAAESARQPAGLSELAAALALDQPRTSRLVARAVAAGLALRGADQADGRRTLLTLTGAGRTACEQVRGFRRQLFSEAMSGWTDAERATFAELLERFVSRLAQAGGA